MSSLRYCVRGKLTRSAFVPHPAIFGTEKRAVYVSSEVALGAVRNLQMFGQAYRSLARPSQWRHIDVANEVVRNNDMEFVFNLSMLC